MLTSPVAFKPSSRERLGLRSGLDLSGSTDFEVFVLLSGATFWVLSRPTSVGCMMSCMLCVGGCLAMAPRGAATYGLAKSVLFSGELSAQNAARQTEAVLRLIRFSGLGVADFVSSYGFFWVDGARGSAVWISVCT